MQRGFTLIELIAIIMIIGILAVVAIPRMDGGQMYRERGFHDALVSTLSESRRLAVASRNFVCVNINGVTGGVALTRATVPPQSVLIVNCNSALTLASRQSNCPVPQHHICAPQGVVLNGGAVTNLIFDPQGRLIQQGLPPTVIAANPTIGVTNQPRVTVEAATGFVQ